MTALFEPTPLDALSDAVARKGLTREAVRTLCRDHFGVETFSALHDPERVMPAGRQWELVCLIDPESTGPYGYSMEPF